MQFYRLVEAEWGDWYLIPADKEKQWDKHMWKCVEGDSDHLPSWAKEVNLDNLTFCLPKVNNLDLYTEL